MYFRKKDTIKYNIRLHMVECVATMSDEENSLSSTSSPPQGENFLSSASSPPLQGDNLNTDNISEAVNAVLKGQY